MNTNGKSNKSSHLQIVWFQGLRACLLQVSFLQCKGIIKTKAVKDGDEGQGHLQRESDGAEELSSNTNAPSSPGSSAPKPAPPNCSPRAISTSSWQEVVQRDPVGVSPRVGTPGEHPRHSTPAPNPPGEAQRHEQPGQGVSGRRRL